MRNNKIGINIYSNYSIDYIRNNNSICSGNYHKERCINQKLYGIVLFKYPKIIFYNNNDYIQYCDKIKSRHINGNTYGIMIIKFT